MADRENRRTKLTLNNILNTVRDASCKKWFERGLALGVKESVLEDIEVDHRIDGVERCQREMYSRWLDDDAKDENDPRSGACWEKLAACLCKSGDKNLGQQIANREGFDLDDAIKRYYGPIGS